ncbi:MAG TPA: phosphotransferase [Micromonosporaceae bacterium]
MPVPRRPPFRYQTTAVRPRWPDLPPDLRHAIEDRLGAPVIAAESALGGFTGGFAAVLDTAAGGRVFVKAAALTEQAHLADWYAREATLTAALPIEVPAPRIRWTLVAAGYFVSCADAITGRMPDLPWQPDELDAALSAYARAAAALREPTADLLRLGLPSLADLATGELAWWQEVAAGREEMPPGPPDLSQRLADLVDLEARLPHYAHGARGVIHGDLRLDNTLIDTAGNAWICDWTWPCHGPAWFDLVGLLVTAHASGLDADTLFAEHPAGLDAPPDALDVALAALSGYWLTGAAATPPLDASPHLRQHRRWSGEAALAWLAERSGWG